jgi:hypothetical protein
MVKLSLSKAFCDTPDGWAIYNGELRHNSNAMGEKYGEVFGPGDIIGVNLDMQQGTISFSKNSVEWGVAFRSEELKKGCLYAAVSPIYIKDEYMIIHP